MVEVHKYGILETNEAGKVTGFLEKPQPSETSSRKEVRQWIKIGLVLQLR